MMTFPTIHANGTHPDTLKSDLDAAYEAIETAVDRLRQAAPNGRDYYPQGDAAFTAAANEHRDRIGKLRGVQAEIEAVMEAIDKQIRG